VTKIRLPKRDRTTGSHAVLDRLFVYGTMRRGQTARALVANSIVRTAPGTVRGQIYAFPMGYPGYVEGDGIVIGEVLWLDQLAATFALLDAYEGTDFVRGIITVTVDDPTEPRLDAWIYRLAAPAAIELGSPIADGDWVRYWSAQE
jgi:gamma-glutamylcyclotransferase (GGCT)/AIG2-like uncharacterized protein YtfP